MHSFNLFYSLNSLKYSLFCLFCTISAAFFVFLTKTYLFHVWKFGDFAILLAFRIIIIYNVVTGSFPCFCIKHGGLSFLPCKSFRK